MCHARWFAFKYRVCDLDSGQQNNSFSSIFHSPNFRFFDDSSSFPDFNACLMTPTVSTLSSSSFSLKWKIGFSSSFLIRLLIFDFFIFREDNKVFLEIFSLLYAFKTKPLETTSDPRMRKIFLCGKILIGDEMTEQVLLNDCR